MSGSCKVQGLFIMGKYLVSHTRQIIRFLSVICYTEKWENKIQRGARLVNRRESTEFIKGS
jgi:hypothetical protein